MIEAERSRFFTQPAALELFDDGPGRCIPAKSRGSKVNSHQLAVPFLLDTINGNG